MGNSVPKGERVVEVFNCELDCGDYVVVSLLPKQVISSERRTGDEGEGSERPLEESIDSGYEEPNQCIRSDQQHGKIEVWANCLCLLNLIVCLAGRPYGIWPARAT